MRAKIIDLPADTAVGLGLVSDSYDVLEASVGDCENPDIAQAIVAGLDFGSLASEVQTAIDEIDRTSLADIAKQVGFWLMVENSRPTRCSELGCSCARKFSTKLKCAARVHYLVSRVEWMARDRGRRINSLERSGGESELVGGHFAMIGLDS